jgi:DNA-directed RNA polymerase specialized sigma24 family protein
MIFERMRWLMGRIPHARAQLRRAYSRATRITPILSDMPRGGSNESQVERGYQLIEAAQTCLDELLAELRELQDAIRPYIDHLDDLEQRAIRMRYLECRSVREISVRTAYSDTYLFRVLKRAEQKVDEMRKHDTHDTI